jgi:hypothetical protein
MTSSSETLIGTNHSMKQHMKIMGKIMKTYIHAPQDPLTPMQITSMNYLIKMCANNE